MPSGRIGGKSVKAFVRLNNIGFGSFQPPSECLQCLGALAVANKDHRTDEPIQ